LYLRYLMAKTRRLLKKAQRVEEKAIWLEMRMRDEFNKKI